MSPVNRSPRRIYAIYSDRKALTAFGGDMISELESLRWMSQGAEVYYNNTRFDPVRAIAGEEAAEVAGPVGDYDLAYIRANVDVLAQCKKAGIPTLYFGELNPEVFALADYIAVHTQGEARHFTRMAAQAGFSIKTFLMEQPGRADFSPRQGEVETETRRRRWGGGFNLGFFGRIDAAAFPDTFMSIRDLVRFYIRDVSIVFAGKLRWKYQLPGDVYYEREYLTGNEMPYALSACAASIGIEQPEAEWAGSNRTLDAIRCGVPIITRPYAARVEQLGEDYPLYFTDPVELLRKLIWLRYDTAFQDDVAAHMAALPARFSHEAIQGRNAERLDGLFESLATRTKKPRQPRETTQRRRKTKT